MDHYIEGVSDIQDTEDMTGSRTTGVGAFFSPRSVAPNIQFTYESPINPNINYQESLLDDQAPPEEDFSFYSCREYVERTLGTWGLTIGNLHQTEENKITLKCFMQLINLKHKQNESRQKLKAVLAESDFQKKKYQSLLDQAKINNDEKNKKIGKMENSFQQLRAKLKKLQQQSKKEKEEDKKMIGMLKSKNQQILHEVKKREQQVNRVKQQMKKNVGEKGAIKAASFEVYQVPHRVIPSEADDKINILTERYENQRKTLVKENLMLKEKLYDIRSEIVEFAQWIDINVFGQPNPNYQNKFIVNHNLLFRKESIVDELHEILDDAKNGIQQVMDGMITNQQKQDDKRNRKQNAGKITNLYASQNIMRQQPSDISSKNSISTSKKMPNFQKNKPTMPKLQETVPTFKKSPTPPQIPTRAEQKNSKKVIKKAQIQQDSDISMISHISMNQIAADNKKFDKWDILFKHQNDSDDDYPF